MAGSSPATALRDDSVETEHALKNGLPERRIDRFQGLFDNPVGSADETHREGDANFLGRL
jgi:hypothetical protein